MLLDEAQKNVDAKYNKYRQLAEMSYKIEAKEPVAAQ
jgi:hypothetical protein